jgi:hypothetical protein
MIPSKKATEFDAKRTTKVPNIDRYLGKDN